MRRESERPPPDNAAGRRRVRPPTEPIQRKRPSNSSRGAARNIASNAAAAVGFGDKPPPRRLRIWKWTPVRRPSLAGFVCVELSSGLRISDLPVFRTGSTGPWVGTPKAARECFAWRNRQTADAFSRAVIGLLLAKYPDALDPPADPPPPRESRPPTVEQPSLLELRL